MSGYLDLTKSVVFNSNQDILGHVKAKLLIVDSCYRTIMEKTCYQLVSAWVRPIDYVRLVRLKGN
jgi:hypothetical protein